MFRVYPSLLAVPVALYAALTSSTALAQSAPLVDVCSGLSVDLPVLQPVANTLDLILQPVANLVDTSLRNQLSGQTLGVSVLDTQGHAVSTNNGCGLSTDTVAIDANQGITMGGGQLTGLGGAGNAAASAGEVNSIAVGNGATTTTAATGSVALGLRGTVSAVDGVALGRDTTASVSGGVAVGAGAVAGRGGMNGTSELFSGTSVASTAGALSVGSVGGERQITNVAGGTADTDAVNVRQLRAVNDSLSTRIDGVEGDVTTLRQDVTNMSGNVTTLQNNITTVSNHVNTLQTTVDTIQQDVSTVNTRVDGLTTRVDGLDTRVDGLDIRVDGVSAGLGGVATALGGGATYNTTTNSFTGPSYTLRGNTYSDVGSALTALNSAIGGAGTNGAVAGNNTTGLADAVATGADATAVGYGASASHANSTAIGTGASTSRANQVAIGTSSNTYTMAGVTSAASRAAQSGATQVLTTDAAGNIATANVDLGGMQTDLSGLKSDVSKLSGDLSSLRKESRQGIATAMAMVGGARPSAPGKTSWSTNVATYKGEMATSFSMAHMFDTSYPVVVDAAVGYAPGGAAGVRVGVSGEF